MNQCLYCTDHVPAFSAFCNATCEGLFAIAEANECSLCQEDYRVVGFTRNGRPVMGCRACGESYEVAAAGVA